MLNAVNGKSFVKLIEQVLSTHVNLKLKPERLVIFLQGFEECVVPCLCFVRNLAFSRHLVTHILARQGLLERIYRESILNDISVSQKDVLRAKQAVSILWILISQGEKVSSVI